MEVAQHSVLAPLSGCCPHLRGRLSTRYSPVCHSGHKSKLLIPSFDLHVLSTPPAFVLSQDQTLHKRAVSASALTDILAICRQANSIHFDFMAQIIRLRNCDCLQAIDVIIRDVVGSYSLTLVTKRLARKQSFRLPA